MPMALGNNVNLVVAGRKTGRTGTTDGRGDGENGVIRIFSGWKRLFVFICDICGKDSGV